MGRKKKKQMKPWCWYCNREFDDEKILVQHQKAKHFKCHICHKKLYTGPGLSIHCMQVHKEKVDRVPNAVPGRTNIDIEIYGMEGIPEEDMRAHENSKSSSEPPEKKSKTDDDSPGVSNGTSPAPSMPMMPPMPPGGPLGPGMPPMPMGPMGFGPMGMPPMPPGPMRMPPGGHMMRGPMMGHRIPMPISSAGTIKSGPTKPLFPAAGSVVSASSTPVGPDFKPTSSATVTTAATISAAPTVKKSISEPTIAAGNNAKIIHPSEDISLEEFRAAIPKYSKTMKKPFSSASSTSISPSTASPASIPPPLMGGPMMHPGGPMGMRGPMPPMMGPPFSMGYQPSGIRPPMMMHGGRY